MEENKDLEKQTVFKEDEKKIEKEDRTEKGSQATDMVNQKTHESEKSSQVAMGLEENIAGLLCYLFWFVSGIIFLLMEKDNEFVRFHAMQSIVFFLGYFIISFVLGFIPILGIIISILMAPVGVVIAIFLMYKAYKGEKFKLPIVGDMAEQFLNK